MERPTLKSEDTEDTVQAPLACENSPKGESADRKRTKTGKQQTPNATHESDERTHGSNAQLENKQSVKSNKHTEVERKDAQQPAGHPGVATSILETGIISFFIRGRVGIEDPDAISDIAQTYILLRPMAQAGKSVKGLTGNTSATRLLVLPKKVLPSRGERFMLFVEKANASDDEIKDDFLASSDYETKTAGTHHTPAATQVGEGIYAITTTGRETHLAYMMTLPKKLGNIQREMGLKDRGSFIMSTKNPLYKGPPNAQLPTGPNFSKEILEDFRSLRWLPSNPAHLDYVNAQFLLIGESSSLDKAVGSQEADDGMGETLEVLEDQEVEDPNKTHTTLP
ncbi:Uncharacterized protein TPAR_00586 [Tolypocladium paradoxum]|uniref:BTB domain transcription factor n=1 Tax=Tolypocladium paradoxum TaxID=94208 RepID=A0A2S4L9U3_9HYPO|nr:Uncharacterized protein TPAR_00586 [Tolypocladium paradoxum]